MPDEQRANRPKQRVTGSACGRRAVLLAGLGTLVGCATSNNSVKLPPPIWPTLRPGTGPLASGGIAVPAATASIAGLSGVLARSNWARGGPVVSRAKVMVQPIRYVTIHHDGMPPFAATDLRAVAARIDLIRRAHLNRNGGGVWADIGYHFVIDRAGRVWEARSLGLQGAHVKDQNEGNIGVLCLGNFEEQRPTEAQLRSLEKFTASLRKRFRVPGHRVLTHREWQSANTLCPGQHLQEQIRVSRSAGRLG